MRLNQEKFMSRAFGLQTLKDAAWNTELLFFISIFIVKLSQFIRNAANFIGKFGHSNTFKRYVQNVRKKITVHGIRTLTFIRGCSASDHLAILIQTTFQKFKNT